MLNKIKAAKTVNNERYISFAIPQDFLSAANVSHSGTAYCLVQSLAFATYAGLSVFQRCAASP